MFGLSVKAWIVDSQDGEDEFCLILSQSQSDNINNFLPALLELLETEFSLDKVSTAFLQSLIPDQLKGSAVRPPPAWSSAKAMNKINEKLGLVGDTNTLESKSQGSTDPLSVTVEQAHGDLFLGNILDSGDDGLEDIYDESIEKLIEKPKISPTYCCFVEDCDLSDRKFSSNAKLRRHQRETHGSLYCGSCNTVSNTAADQLTHNCSKRHKCQVCARLFATANELLHHKYIHTGEKPHVCHICGKDFRQRATLDRHKITHDTKREHECEVCHKKFKHKHYLASHKLLHEGVKPHICSWCGLGFTQNSNLQKHVRQKHTQEKAFICNKCGKGFVQPYYLRRHLKSHKGAGEEDRASFDFLVGSDQSDQCGLRVASCHLCSATCKGPAELEKHLAKHHADL